MTTLTVTKVPRRDHKRFAGACTSGRHGACAVDLNHFNRTTSFTTPRGGTHAVNRITAR
jgi:hypothetical protein